MAKNTIPVDVETANDLMAIQEAARRIRDRFAEKDCLAAIPELHAALERYDDRLRAQVEAKFETIN